MSAFGLVASMVIKSTQPDKPGLAKCKAIYRESRAALDLAKIALDVSDPVPTGGGPTPTK